MLSWAVVWRVFVAAYAIYNIGGAPGAAEGWKEIVQPLGLGPGRVIGFVLLVAIVVSLLPSGVRKKGWDRTMRWLGVSPRRDTGSDRDEPAATADKQAPIRIRVEPHPRGVIQLPPDSPQTVAVAVRIDNEGDDDLTDVAMNFAVPRTLGLAARGPSGEVSKRGSIVRPPDSPEHYWQDTGIRLYGRGWTTEFNFNVVVSSPGTYRMKVSLRIPGFPSQIQYAELVVEEARPVEEDAAEEDAADLPKPQPASGGSLSALEREYARGDGMLEACNPFGSTIGHGPPPTDEAIDAWKRRVLAALPDAYKRRFQFGGCPSRR